MLRCKICQDKLEMKFRKMFDNRHGYPGHFNIYECCACGFMQTEPQLAGRLLTQIYSKYYPRRDANIETVRQAGKNIPSWEEIKRKGLITTCHYGAVNKGDKVLDVGSGACYSLVEISAMGGRAWGIDPDENSEKVAKKLKFMFHKGLIYNCPFSKNSYDLITASQVLEHEPEPLKFLSTAKKFLKPEGKIRLSFPNNGALFSHLWGRNWLHWHVPYHVNHFNKNSFEILAEKAGLKIISSKTATPNLWTILQVKLWLSNPKIGVPEEMWGSSLSSSKTKLASSQQKLIGLFLPYLERLLFFNRLIDNIGLGESFVVELIQS